MAEVGQGEGGWLLAMLGLEDDVGYGGVNKE